MSVPVKMFWSSFLVIFRTRIRAESLGYLKNNNNDNNDDNDNDNDNNNDKDNDYDNDKDNDQQQYQEKIITIIIILQASM